MLREMMQTDTRYRGQGESIASGSVFLFVWALLLSFNLFAGCDTGGQSEVQVKSVRFYLFNNAGGEVDPCGCPGNPAGGFAKRAGFLGARNNEATGSVTRPIVVDAGDLIDRRSVIPFDQREEAKLRARLAVKVLNLTKIDVFVPGDGDLAIGWNSFYKTFQNAEFQILTANLHDYYMDRQAYPGSVVLERDGVRIGLIGLVSHDLTRGLDSVILKEVRVDDPVQAAAREVANLRNQVDLLVVVAHLSRMELKRVATETAGIDLIFSGHHQKYFISKAKAESGPFILQTGKGGQKVGSLHVSLQNKKGPIQDQAELNRMKSRLASMKRDLDASKIDSKGNNGRRDDSEVIDIKGENRSLLDDYNELHTKIQSIDTGNFFLFQLVTLGNRVTSQPKVEGWVAEYKKSIGADKDSSLHR